MIFCGNQLLFWVVEDIINYIEFKLGYICDSFGFLRFVRVLCGMFFDERKVFLQFIIGCLILFLGGLVNLYFRFMVVCKVDVIDVSYLLVNICVYYFKLFEYFFEEIMRECLLVVIMEKGFYFN